MITKFGGDRHFSALDLGYIIHGGIIIIMAKLANTFMSQI